MLPLFARRQAGPAVPSTKFQAPTLPSQTAPPKPQQLDAAGTQMLTADSNNRRSCLAN